ncbi:MAG TPA: DUF2252 family protein [Rudaea sp.]|jgi:uncharacterized protein (DUF2252 family)|uniref:DUF2252 domain-containing protein n=1 Tax=Rudaea sp. TaxID=2136325 RepID=UPI002F95ADC0
MDVAKRIFRFNAGRDARLLERKYARIAADPFVFLRGTCHLFFEDWRGGRELDAAPNAWICGDLHLENLGSYKGDNRLAYFDINDFDEAALAPCTWEVARFLVSLHVGTRSLGLDLREARALSRCFLDAYVAALADGKPRWIERSIADGLIGTLLGRVEQRRRKDFLNRHTVKDGKRRRFLIDDEHLLALKNDEREALLDWFGRYAARQPDAKFYRPLDVAQRIAGTGSLGLARYAILAQGKGSPNGNYVLDLKLAGNSSVGKRLPKRQPEWPDEAMRIVTVQKRMQAIAPAFLTPVDFVDRAFVLKELQPLQDRLDLSAVQGKVKPLSAVIGSMGQLVAWSALRGSGRQGAACADDLIAFAQDSRWTRALIDYVEDYTPKVIADWRRFRKVWQSMQKQSGKQKS